MEQENSAEKTTKGAPEAQKPPLITVGCRKMTPEAHKRMVDGLRPWQPGQSGNPSGRPKNRVSITTCLKRTLALKPDLAQALVDTWIARCLAPGPGGTKDLSMLLDRVDGAVARTVQVEDITHVKRLGFSDPLLGTAEAVIEAEARVRTLLGDAQDSAGDGEEDSDSAATLPVEVEEEGGEGSEEEEEGGQV